MSESGSQKIVASYCATFLKPEMRHIYRQVSALQRYRTVVITRQRQCEQEFPFDDVRLVPKVRKNFVRRFWQKYIKKEPPIVYRGEYQALAGVLDQAKVDLMHVYFGHTGVHLLPFLKRWPFPALVSFHGMDVQPREGQPGYVENLRSLLQTLPLVLARSESLRDRLIDLGCPSEKIRLNRTGIPLDAFPWTERPRWHPTDPQAPLRLVQACRLIEKKGLDVALRAFSRLREDFPAATFTIAGEGPLLEPLKKLVSELSLSEAVEFTGFLDQTGLRQLYHRSHLFIHPSQLTADKNQEGIPNSMLEAMATGLPVVATLHGGIPEAVRHSITGLLGPERDEEALLSHMKQLATNPTRWQQMSQAAATDMRENFEHSAQITKLESFYDEAIKRFWDTNASSPSR